MRKPVVAGQFYPAGKKALTESLQGSFRKGCGEKPGAASSTAVSEDPGRFVGVVVPHAGFMFSGATASYSYAYLVEQGFPETIVLLGPLHYPVPEKVYLSMEDFGTPLGVVENDTMLGELLMEGRSPLHQSDRAHVNEHSLEVQLPFLQYVAPAPFKIVPIGFSRKDPKTAKTLGKHIASVIKRYQEKHGKTVGVVASSDFSHVGRNYGFVPVIGPGEVVVNWMKKHDGKAMELITQMNTDAFYKYKRELGLTICGAAPIMTLMEVARTLGVPGGELLHYETSYRVSKNPGTVVGYGAIGFSSR